MKKGFFIAGTDTGIGKTFVSCALLQVFANKGEPVGAMKPIAAGCEKTPDGWQNDDAQQLMHHTNIELSYQQVNPIALPPPIAPHIAIEQAGESVTIAQLTKHFEQIKDRADYFIVEGAGGWLVPLNKNESMADIPKAFGLDVILVVGIRLGCINHALLTVDAIQQSGNQLAGWVANIIEPEMLMVEENILTLRNSINAPLLGTIPNLDVKNEVSIAAKKLDVDFLLELSKPHLAKTASELLTPTENLNHKTEVIKRFWEECIWAKSTRNHFLELYECGDKRKELLSEVANTFFSDLNILLQEYIILQICKLTDPAHTGKKISGKNNLTTNYIISLDWPSEVEKSLTHENNKIMLFRSKVNDARRKAIAHADLKIYTNEINLGSFEQADEIIFWESLERFINLAHQEVFGESCEIDLPMPDGNVHSLIHHLRDGIDYKDIINEKPSFISSRTKHIRYDDA